MPLSHERARPRRMAAPSRRTSHTVRPERNQGHFQASAPNYWWRAASPVSRSSCAVHLRLSRARPLLVVRRSVGRHAGPHLARRVQVEAQRARSQAQQEARAARDRRRPPRRPPASPRPEHATMPALRKTASGPLGGRAPARAGAPRPRGSSRRSTPPARGRRSSSARRARRTRFWPPNPTRYSSSWACAGRRPSPSSIWRPS